MGYFMVVDNRYGRDNEFGRCEVYCGATSEIGVRGDPELMQQVADFLNDESDPVARALAEMLMWEHLP